METHTQGSDIHGRITREATHGIRLRISFPIAVITDLWVLFILTHGAGPFCCLEVRVLRKGSPPFLWHIASISLQQSCCPTKLLPELESLTTTSPTHLPGRFTDRRKPRMPVHCCLTIHTSDALSKLLLCRNHPF